MVGQDLDFFDSRYPRLRIPYSYAPSWDQYIPLNCNTTIVKEPELDELGLEPEVVAALNKWINRRVSRLEYEAKEYREREGKAMHRVWELLDENARLSLKIKVLEAENHVLKLTGYFPDNVNNPENKTRFSALEL